MDKRVEKISMIMEHLAAEVQPLITSLWNFLGRSKDVKITVFVSIDGHKGNMMFANVTDDPWKHQDRIAKELEENKLEKGKTMVELVHFGQKPK